MPDPVTVRAPNPGRLIGITEAADRLDCSTRYVRRLISERRIAFHRIGRHIRLHTTDIDDFIAAGRVEAMPTPRRY